MSRIDLVISELCDEIDDLSSAAEFWRNKYLEVNAKYNDALTSSIKQSHAVGLGMVAIATHDKDLAAAVARLGDEEE